MFSFTKIVWFLKSFAKKLHTVNSLVFFEDFLAYMAEGFWKFLVGKSLASLFCMSHVHAHNSQLRMQTLLAVDFLSNLLYFPK